MRCILFKFQSKYVTYIEYYHDNISNSNKNYNYYYYSVSNNEVFIMVFIIDEISRQIIIIRLYFKLG
jgi:hypothetical protein